MTYVEKLKDPRWQKMRLKILERDDWACQMCFDCESTLHIHHRRYLPNRAPWDYPENILVTLCEACHEYERDQLDVICDDVVSFLREKFFSDSIVSIAHGFYSMNLLHLQDVVASAISWTLGDDKAQSNMIKAYFKHLAEKRKKNA